MRIMKTPGNWIGSALCSLATVTQAGASPIDGIWEAVLAGHTHMIALVERSDGRLLGYTPSSPGSWVVGGQRIGSAVTINLEARDPGLSSDPATFSGVRRGSHITGTLTDSTGTTAITLHEVHAPRTLAHWLLGPSISGDVLNRAIRVENNAGRFVAGGFVGLTDCSFLACGGHITSWTVAGTDHTILTDSGGVCPSTSALVGSWDVPTLLVNGTYTTAASCLPPPAGGRFFGGKEGLTDMGDILDVLGLLRDFADRIEAESPAAAHAFAATYLHDGKTRAMGRLIFALGIRFVGEATANVLAQHFKTLEAIQEATRDELLQVEGIGPQIADSITEFFQNDKNQALIEKLKAAGVHPLMSEEPQAAQLAGKTFVFTGGLKKFSREEAKALVTAQGGKVASSVSAKTDFVVVGEEPGSKYGKAKALGLTVLDEAGFENLVGRKA